MKKVKLIIAAVAMMGLVSSSLVYADGFAPGEGLYIGGFVGTGSGLVQPKVATNGNKDGSAVATDGNDDGTYEMTEGGIGMFGIEGGGILGYGYKMGDLYAGLEGEWAASDVEFKLTSNIGVQMDLRAGDTTANEGADKTYTELTATKEWTGGMFGRLGYYINSNTLFSAKAGVLVSKFEVAFSGTDPQSENFYGGGPAFGVALDSAITAIDPNLSLRVGAVYTDFLTASVHSIGTSNAGSNVDAEVTGSSLSARMGLTYSFLDVNSLF